MDTKSKVKTYSNVSKAVTVVGMFCMVIIASLLLLFSHADIYYSMVSHERAVANELAPNDSEMFYLLTRGNFIDGLTEDSAIFQEYYDRGYRLEAYSLDGNLIYSNLDGAENRIEQVYTSNDMFIDLYVSNDMYNSVSAKIFNMSQRGIFALVALIVVVVSFFVFSGFYCRMVGQKFKGDEVEIGFLNRVYNDILTVVIGGLALLIIAFLGYLFLDVIIQNTLGNMTYVGISYQFSLLLFITAVLVLTVMWIYYTDCVARRVKRREFFRYTLVAKIFGWLVRNSKRLGRALKAPVRYFISQMNRIADKNVRNWTIGVGAAAILVNVFWISFIYWGFYGPDVVWFLILTFVIFTIAVLTLLVIKHLADFEMVKKGIEEIRNGNTDYKIPPLSSPTVEGMAENVNNIGDGIAVAVNTALTSEKMKSELVTNVSHDLKTPLTSVIGYIDLLSKVEDLPDEAMDYVSVLQEKAHRLSGIVSDVFDLAKSTSGNAEVEIERLDLKRLIEQTLGDLGEKIEYSGLNIKTVLPENEVFIEADGKRLYRVMQNIIDNALQYSLQGTRIFIKLAAEDERAKFEMNNIAGYDMDFTENDIIQRFVRGDSARSTDGSGLGLSIAQSFTELCGGSFDIKVDGDMFKVMMSFAISKDSSTEK